MTGRKAIGILALVVLGLLILITLQNLATVQIVVLFWSFSISRALMLLIVFCVGVIVGWALPQISKIKFRGKRDPLR